MDGDWDFIVIGGGSAGAVVANRLSADPDVRVLLLDAGRSHRHPFVEVPALMMLSFPRRDMNWQYIAEPDPSRDGRVDMWPAGRTLGGGSALNGMMFVRGHGYDYDLWAQAGNRGWSHNDLLPFFRCMENSDTGANHYRGADGPLSVARPRSPHVLVEPFIDACEEVGIPRAEDLNGENAEGAAICQASQRRGRRHSTAHAYIDPVRRRANLKIVLGAQVEAIELEGRRARHVRFSCEGVARRVTARKGVVLSAGAIGSPKILMLSGFGDAEELRALGIEPVADIPGIGRNLQEHSGTSLRFEVKVPTLTSDQGPLRSPRHLFDYLLRGRGPLATPIGHAQAFVRTEDGLAAPDIQIILSPFAYDIVDGQAKRKKTPEMALAVGLCRPRAIGRVSLRSADPAAPPVIEHALLGEEADVRQLVAGLRIARRIIRSDALAPHVVREVTPGRTVEDEADLTDYVRSSAYLMFHSCGTCKMGQGTDAVVDERLRVRGIDGLWVADASIIPTIPAGNINATCIMIGEKAAHMIMEDTRQRDISA